MTSGRPRDLRIDDAVLRATVELLPEVGYLQLTIAAIAERAGTNKPAIYRRWPTKAHLVHEAVFPSDGAEVTPLGDDLRGDLRALVTAGVAILSRPATRAALPGLLAEMAGAPEVHAEILERFATGTWGWMHERIEQAVRDGELRPGVSAATVLDLIAGSTLMATAIRPSSDVDKRWVDGIVDVIIRGIEA